MSLGTGRSRLYASLEALRHRWQQTQELWTDSVRRDFEENHWEPLEQQVVDVLHAIDQLAQVLAQAKQECSDS
ncbi:MAG: hypothetical protein ACK4RK_06325 [Gemmataceae bacterium]